VKACVLRRQAPIASRPLAFEEVADPTPGPGEVLVRVRACGICRTDLHVVEGDLPLVRSPVIPGHQAVGDVVSVGAGVTTPAVGERVGIAWLHRTDGTCRFCLSGRENLCTHPVFTGWTADGGFAELAVAPAAFVHRLPAGFADRDAAPLLCAGIIGFRAMRLTGLGEPGRPWAGARLGIYGFGAAGHVAIQLARGRGADVYVATRDRTRHQALAAELGATWVGDTAERPPVELDAAIIFAPAGELVPAALGALDRGGVVVLGGIHMSPVPSLPYDLLYEERVVRSVANNTRDDARAFLDEAARLPVRTHVQVFELAAANDALLALARDGIRGAGVLAVSPMT
jgi:propanol-preferring alcohol dehydrogenase